ncbi:ATP-binding protein [Streptomyces cathayae]|uniref:ATP-binding protein n=1 Tax=Streptomyces cathayae TaxID=3031124 RepID=A0ABY8JWW1_9ACTN|nr:ATP-binding protein [Streptomyces sp. HUAS 5]WGD40487.1 ATP-binding protein [Streptomyces sp. HUAS 5]
MPLCPTAPTYPADPTVPTPETLAYSFTLPASLASPAFARTATRQALKMHGLSDMLDPALQVVGELTATACQFTESPNYYLSLRYRAGTLRLIAYDSHPRHTQPHLSTACDTRRHACLRLLARICRACDGSWGFGDSHEPGGGTRMWVSLPREGATAYGTT